jgi:hypothetical protein
MLKYYNNSKTLPPDELRIDEQSVRPRRTVMLEIEFVKGHKAKAVVGHEQVDFIEGRQSLVHVRKDDLHIHQVDTAIHQELLRSLEHLKVVP